jgi:hypothetical protein
MVSAAPADAVTAGQPTDLTQALRDAPADVGAFTVRLGSAPAGRTGALLDVHPDAQVNGLRSVTRGAVEQVLPSDFACLVSPVHMSWATIPGRTSR